MAWLTTADQTWPSTAIPTFVSAVFPHAWRALRWVRVRWSKKKPIATGNRDFFLAKNLHVKSLIKSILQNSVNFAPLISVIIIYFMTLK